MDAADQRKLGLKLATEAGATETVALIKDTSTSYAEILKSAVSEIGAEKLYSIIGSANEPSWAFNTLLHIKDIGGDEKALIKQATLRHEERIVVDGPTAAALTPISGFTLNLVAGVGFTCQYTMYWISAPGVTQPNAGTPNQGSWKFSITLDAVSNNSWTMQCKDFALPDSPLSEGDTVWMVIDINCGARYEMPQRFMYSNGTGNNAVYDTYGAVTNPQFVLKSS